MIQELLIGKTGEQIIDIKATEIAKYDHTGTFDNDSLQVEIESLEKIEGGVEVYVRAWRNGKPVGFGDGGWIETERIRILNPPIMVRDGTQINLGINPINKMPMFRDGFKEDPVEAIRQSLANIISVIGEPDADIIKGTIGNTTTTVYPQTGGGGANATTDGTCRYAIASPGVSWATLIGHAGNSASNSATGGSNTGECQSIGAADTSNQWREARRAGFSFDTSGIPDTDVISAATFSLWGLGVTTVGLTASDFSLNVYSWTPAANNDIVAGDYATFGTTAYSTTIASASWGNGAYQDFAFNATGISAISKTGVTPMGVREVQRDVGATQPTWASTGTNEFNFYFADQAGTANDPMLVIVHAAAASSSISPSSSPSSSPSASPSRSPSSSPSVSPSSSPSSSPSLSPSSSPSISPSTSPSISPSSSLSASPSLSPSTSASLSPSASISPSPSPSVSPSASPSISPSASPSFSPSPSLEIVGESKSFSILGNTNWRTMRILKNPYRQRR